MRKKKKDVLTAPAQSEEKVLDVNAAMQGTLRFDDPVNLRISGKFEGALETKGKLMIGSKAEIKASITGEIIHIDGVVTGDIKASALLKLASTAKLNGDVETPKLIIDEGAILIGQVRMEKGAAVAAASASFSGSDIMNATQVAKYLEVDTDKIADWASSGMLPGVSEKGEWRFDRKRVDEWVSQGKIKG
jgi:excisionase family DNA binding protein